MKKLFLLIPALAITLMANAKVINVQPGNNTIRYAIAASTTEDGDVLVLADGTYTDDNYIEFNKSVEVRAADGATPLVQLYTYIKVDGSKDVVIKGIVFDGSGQGSYSYTIRQYNVNSLTLDGCEFRNMKNIVIYGATGTHTGALNVNNCYFHNNQKQSIYFDKSTTEGTETCDELTVTNSTFANTTALTDWRSIIEVRPFSTTAETVSDAIKVVIDHCTFYNNPCVDSGHANIRTHFSSDVTVSNCIFMHPTELAQRAVYCDGGGTVSNCLTYNFTKDTERASISYGCTAVNCFAADPLFTDAANGDFSFAGNWVTMALSPARGAATDGSDLGDPRWYSAETLPESNFVAPYAFLGEKAVVSNNMELDANNYIHSKSAGGSAIWKIHATRAGSVQVTLNMDPDGQVIGHTYHVEVFDADDHSIGEVNEGDWSNNVDDKVLSGTIAFPAEGDYKIVLTNTVSGTKSTIKGITLAYVGGAVVTVPAEELLGTEAVLVNDGSLKVSKLENGDLKYGDNGAPLTEYVYWNINSTKAGNMKVTLNVVAPTSGSASTHDFLVELYSDLNGSPIASSAEASATSGTGARVLPDAINIPAAGNYIVKLTNQTQWSSAILHSIQFEYLGGATITVPADALIGEEAVLVDEGHLKVSKLANGDLKYGDNGNPLDEYVYWNINATKYGRMNVTANVVAPGEGDPSGHQFLVELYSDLNESPIVSTVEPASTSTTGAIALPAINIPAIGNYIVKLTNQKQWSSAILHSIELAYAGGEVANVPGQILGVDAMLLKEDGGTLKMYHDENGDIQYNDNGYNLTEYALWNIHADAACELSVTLNIAHSGHMFTVELYDGETLLGTAIEADATKWDDGNIELEDHLNIPAAGNYTIKLINRQQYSGGALHGITFTEIVAPVFVEIDETADAPSWTVSDDLVNVRLLRTFKGGMYNTICLPFAVSSDKLVAAFGEGVELLNMETAIFDGTMLDLQFASSLSGGIYQGTPYLIKPAADVVNPEFEDVSFKKMEASATSGTNADFIGNFIAGEVPAGENNLFLGPDNLLYFSQTATPIKGMRAYFQVKGVANPSNAIKRARIVMKENGATAIDLVDVDNNTIKMIENGQVIIIRDGIRYNVMGVKLQ